MNSKARLLNRLIPEVLPGQDAEITPEKKLLYAILLRAIVDAACPPRMGLENIQFIQREAKQWIKSSNNKPWSCLWVLAQIFDDEHSAHELIKQRIEDTPRLVSSLRGSTWMPSNRKYFHCAVKVSYGNIQTGKCVLPAVRNDGQGAQFL